MSNWAAVDVRLGKEPRRKWNIINGDIYYQGDSPRDTIQQASYNPSSVWLPMAWLQGASRANSAPYRRLNRKPSCVDAERNNPVCRPTSTGMSHTMDILCGCWPTSACERRGTNDGKQGTLKGHMIVVSRAFGTTYATCWKG